MKTPLTITASAWNYCQNNCRYCVSYSNDPKWKFHGSFKIYSPPGYERLTDLELRGKFGKNYFERMCPDKKVYLNKKDILDFDYLIKWIHKFVPSCELHVSGGECLLRPDIEDQIEKIVSAGISTTIFTNGMLISKRPRLHSMPLKWVVAHHLPNPLDKWLENVKLIAHRPILTTRLFTESLEIEKSDEIAKDYEGLNFYWCRGNGLKQGAEGFANKDDFKTIASEGIHLIVPDGRVFPCNVHSHYEIGHVMRMEYAPDKARKQDSHSYQCVISNKCPAYQTARMVYEL